MHYLISIIKATTNKIFIFLDALYYSRFIRNLENNRFYGIDKTISFINQLANPKPKSITKSYGKIYDPEAAKRFGTGDIKEYSYWAWRSCAIATVLMILHTERLYKGTLYDLVKEVDKKGGYLKEGSYVNKDIGWKHDLLVKTIRKYGLNASLIKRISIPHLLHLLVLGYYIIASIKSRTQKGGSHMILITGFLKQENDFIFHYFDPIILNPKRKPKTINRNDLTKIFLHKGLIVKNKIDRT